MILKQIIQHSGVSAIRGREDIDIRSICSDSRSAESGALFFAVKGFAADGHRYIASALRKGAAAVVYEDEEALAAELATFSPSNDQEAKSGRRLLLDRATFVRVQNARHAVAVMAANFYGRPSEQLTLVGITGTNGKTTTVTLLYRLFTELGYACGLLSTIANYVGSRRSETCNTTADPITVNALLREMADAGCAYCFMEVSSIGIEQERVSGLHFRAGIFSNLTRDHLDYHKTFQEYLRCKKRFFDSLPEDAVAIVNIDDRNGPVMVQNTAARTVTYSCRGLADHTARVMEQSFDGMMLLIDGRETWTRLIGRHNASNLLAAYSAAVSLGMDPAETLVRLSKIEAAPGRLENRRGPRGLSVIIDYAHTPDALDNVLATLRDIAPGRQLICVFGCGGDRDKTKRPEMARIAEQRADRIFVTSDNSRTEKTEDILDDIRKGFSAAGLAKTLFIADRKEAIRTAILTAPPDAAILLAGKGHEQYQIIGAEKRPFDERKIIDEAFQQLEPI